MKYDAVIVGGGVAGLVAAKHLEEYNLKVLLLERANRLGGRVKTDQEGDFLLDRGFQVLLTAYPAIQKHLDLDKLDLQKFLPGLLSFDQSRKLQVGDPNRGGGSYFGMLFSGIGSFMDKVRMLNLRTELSKKSIDDIFNGPDISSLEYLKKRKFSATIIERFFRPFFGGIFLEQELRTSARNLEFVFKMFAEGAVALPKEGMEAIPRQLAQGLKHTEIRYNSTVERVEPGQVKLKGEESIAAKQIIVASRPAEILPQFAGHLRWNRTHQLYFSSKKAPLKKALIAVSHRESGLVNNLCVLDRVNPAYAPKGEHLIQVSLRTDSNESIQELTRSVKSELADSFGSEVENWQFLRSYQIKEALPIVESPQDHISLEESLVLDGIYLAGDHLLNPSLNAAFQSGETAAKALVLNHVNN